MTINTISSCSTPPLPLSGGGQGAPMPAPVQTPVQSPMQVPIQGGGGAAPAEQVLAGAQQCLEPQQQVAVQGGGQPVVAPAAAPAPQVVPVAQPLPGAQPTPAPTTTAVAGVQGGGDTVPATGTLTSEQVAQIVPAIQAVTAALTALLPQLQAAAQAQAGAGGVTGGGAPGASCGMPCCQSAGGAADAAVAGIATGTPPGKGEAPGKAPDKDPGQAPKGEEKKPEQAPTPPPPPSTAGKLNEAGLTSKGKELDAEQRRLTEIVLEQGKKMGASDKVLKAGVATMIVESTIHNYNFGDRDSQGLFQQRPSQGWGTVDQVRDPVHAATKFFERAINVDKANPNMSMGDLSQKVQVSAFPDRYAEHEAEAAKILAAFNA